MIDSQTLFDQSIKNDTRTCDNIMEIVTGQGNDYTTDCSLDYQCFKENCKLIVIDLRKQQTFVANPKANIKLILQEV